METWETWTELYRQLLKYREALEGPPLLAVCDLNRSQVHTDFTGAARAVYEFGLDGLSDPADLAVPHHIGELLQTAGCDWASVEPGSRSLE